MLGIALAAGISWATSQLTSQRIGLASEPIDRRPAARAAGPRPWHAATTTPKRTQPPTSASPRTPTTTRHRHERVARRSATPAAGEGGSTPAAPSPGAEAGAERRAPEGSGDDQPRRRQLGAARAATTEPAADLCQSFAGAWSAPGGGGANVLCERTSHQMPRRPTNSRIASLAAALVAGALAALALRPVTHGQSASGSGAPVAEVRTQVIRRTIHVVHHERPPQRRAGTRRAAATTAAPTGIHTGSSGSHPSSTGAAPASPRSRTSGAAGAAPTPAGAAPVRTATSGSRSAAPSAGRGSGPVRTRSSGSPGGAGTSTRTHSSGGGHEDRGGRDD